MTLRSPLRFGRVSPASNAPVVDAASRIEAMDDFTRGVAFRRNGCSSNEARRIASTAIGALIADASAASTSPSPSNAPPSRQTERISAALTDTALPDRHNLVLRLGADGVDMTADITATRASPRRRW
jgi:hypothetical protein